ncbi:MAG: hybrid sensor histidine kinase/response regulator [Rhodoferax sp.]|nr:hybrid sensor histidine kinase/response regulator [Rhodoferax sp.]
MAIDIKKFIARFIEEARDHISQLSNGLSALESGQAGKEQINTLFRSAHTIKGSSRMLKLTTITETAHRLEDVLGALRDGSLAFGPTLGQLLYRCVDALSDLLERLAETSDPASLPPPDQDLCHALDQTARGLVAVPAEPATATAPTPEAATAPSAVGSVPTLPQQTLPPATAPAAPPGVATTPRLNTAETVRVRLGKLDALFKLMGEVVSSHARMRQRLQDIRELAHGAGASHAAPDGAPAGALAAALHQFSLQLTEDVQAQEGLMNELHDATLQMRMLPLTIVFEPASRLVRELAHSVGKQVECTVEGSDIELDRQMIDKLSDPIIHLIRNGIDHGLEAPAQRLAHGKPAQGRLTLSARQDGAWVVIAIADDGAGIALDAVRDKAIKKGILSPDRAAALSKQETIDLIFLPGFSTSHIITDLSGRGVGMDVVKQSIIDDLHGVVSVETQAGKGSTFSLRLPLSLAMMRVLLVEVDGLPFGFTAQYVAELLRVPSSTLLTVAERKVVILRNEFVPVVRLADLLGLPSSRVRRPSRDAGMALGLLLLVVKVRHEKIALEVDALRDERDMVIKPLPAHMRRLPLVSGMVTTGKNELVGVLHAPVLLELARKSRTSTDTSAAPTPDQPRARRVLVVDDSLNTREIEKDVLEAHGYHVTLAEDGQDGLRKAMAGEFDAVLTDVEMPHMDGFTLTARLRQEEKYRSKPIVIITSREKEEDKRRGIQVGADAYIVKGDFDQNSLVHTLRALLG